MSATHDINQREYAQLSKLKAGDTLQADADFPCIKPWSIVTVHQDECTKQLYVKCSHVRHELNDDEGDHLIGFYHMKDKNNVQAD